MRYDNGRGGAINYTLDPAGNLLSEATTAGGTTTTRTFEYLGNQLQQITAGGQAQKHFYDPEGNLACITSGSGSQADCPTSPGATPSANVLSAYFYDYLNRLTGYRSVANSAYGSQAGTADYLFDALGRPIEQTGRTVAGRRAPPSSATWG